MKMYNRDGTEGKMCGNGIRCVGKFLYDHGMVNIKEKDEITIETLSGIKSLKAYTTDGEVKTLRVDMGKAILDPKLIPVDLSGDKVVDRRVTIGMQDYRYAGLQNHLRINGQPALRCIRRQRHRQHQP